MAVKKTSYSRNFISRTDQNEIHYYEHPILENHQDISEEDEKMREEIKKRFGFFDRENGGEGFDGKILYSYRIEDTLDSLKESSENVEYQTTIFIKKAGTENEISLPSDLERFLMKSKFKQLK